MMLRALYLLLVLLTGCSGEDASDDGMSAPTGPDTDGSGGLRKTVLVTGLDTPWDLQLGPDGFLWVSERRGVISRVDTSTGDVTPVATLEVSEIGEAGLLGIALHPAFESDPYVYAVHGRDDGGGVRNRLIRMRWDGNRLGPPETLLGDIPGASVHNGSRLAFGPDGMLFVTTGDARTPSSAQDTTSLAGKVLRLTPLGDPAPGNPFGNEIHTFGHRNPQGLVFHPVTGRLYVSEHGPSDNDEVNRLQPGGNFGWPNVHGFCDDDVGGLTESAFCSANDVVEPLVAWTPTIAPSGIDYYDSDRISGWRGSLLMTTLKDATLHRLTLSTEGDAVVDRETLFSGEFGRLRDVLVGPRGEVYIATSNRDGRGSPAAGDDRIIRIEPQDGVQK